MTTFLTAQEMQELISVDRSTVYRMAEDGRLPSVKVDRQWRFPADRMAEQLGTAAPAGLPEEATVAADAAGRTLPSAAPTGSGAPMSPEAAQAIASFVGDMNLLKGEASGSTAATALGEVSLVEEAHGAVELLLRPEDLTVASGGDAEVTLIEFYGHDQMLSVRLANGADVLVRTTARTEWRRGDRVHVGWTGVDAVAFA